MTVSSPPLLDFLQRRLAQGPDAVPEALARVRALSTDEAEACAGLLPWTARLEETWRHRLGTAAGSEEDERAVVAHGALLAMLEAHPGWRDAPDPSFQTALAWAFHLGNVTTIEALLDRGAALAPGERAAALNNVFRDAFPSERRVAVLTLLLDRNEVRQTCLADALMRSARAGDVACFTLLQARGARLSGPADDLIDLLNVVCLADGDVGMADAILQAALAHPDGLARLNADRLTSKSPMHGAACAGSAALLRLLVANGAEVDRASLPPRNDGTPLMMAAAMGRAEAMRALLEMGADPRAEDDDGQTPLHHLASAESFLRNEANGVALVDQCVDLLLVAGAMADLGRRDAYGDTPLDRARLGTGGLWVRLNQVQAEGRADGLRRAFQDGAGPRGRARL